VVPGETTAGRTEGGEMGLWEFDNPILRTSFFFFTPKVLVLAWFRFFKLKMQYQNACLCKNCAEKPLTKC